MPASFRPPATEGEELAGFLAAEGVAPDARILDVPCGIGRRAFGLAERGYRVTAVDANEIAVEALRKRAGEGLAHRLACRSAPKETMPALPASEIFDVILCLDHAVSRDPPGDDVGFLRRLQGHLAPGGFLALDLLHRDFFTSRARPFAYHIIGDVEQHEFRAFDSTSGVLELTWKFYAREGEDLRYQGDSSARLKLLAPHEARKLLESAGWNVQTFYGGWEKEAVAADRRKLLLLARPAARVK